MIHIEEKLLNGIQERAVLVGIWNRNISKVKAEEYLNELALLVEAADAIVFKSFIQRVEKLNSGTLIGKGKLAEIAEYVKEVKADLVVFDHDLSPSQVKNIDKAIGVKVLDRSGIILHIFGERARTAQARKQVELAQLQYMLPRLTGLWTHLSKQRGGIGLKGAGEKEIETDRRMIRKKIALLKEQLKKIDKQNTTRRKARQGITRVALVGYTNAGKSTLMNTLAGARVIAEDLLFATLDTTVRKLRIDHHNFLLSDTVGFIRKLPHNLIECFKSTLDEARESDILLHVIDASHPEYEEQINVVNETLSELKIRDKPAIMVFNKVDAILPEALNALKHTFKDSSEPSIFISAAKNIGILALKEALLRLSGRPSLPDYAL